MGKNKDQMAPMADDGDDSMELDSLGEAIKKVEMAKANQPELYSKALAKLKGHAKVIGSVKELRQKAKDMAEANKSDG